MLYNFDYFHFSPKIDIFRLISAKSFKQPSRYVVDMYLKCKFQVILIIYSKFLFLIGRYIDIFEKIAVYRFNAISAFLFVHTYCATYYILHI